MQGVHGHFCRHCAQTVDQLAFDQFTQLVDKECPVAERLSGPCDTVFGCVDRDVEFDTYVDAHAITGNQACFSGTRHFKTQGLHVDRADFVQQGDDNCAGVHNDAAPAAACFYEADFAGCAFV